MRLSGKRLATALALLALAAAGAHFALADHHGDGHGHGDGDHRRQRECVAPVNNATYRETCGACHFAYQPGLLPAGSWQKIIAGLGDHFGQDVTPDDTDRKAIAAYLEANAADRSDYRRSRKIMDSLGSAMPLRITEAPYIIHKHEDVRPGDYTDAKGQKITLANCAACHTTAEQGVYDDDNVRLPR